MNIVNGQQVEGVLLLYPSLIDSHDSYAYTATASPPAATGATDRATRKSVTVFFSQPSRTRASGENLTVSAHLVSIRDDSRGMASLNNGT